MPKTTSISDSKAMLHYAMLKPNQNEAMIENQREPQYQSLVKLNLQNREAKREGGLQLKIVCGVTV